MISYTSRRLEFPRGRGYRAAVYSLVITATATCIWWPLGRSRSMTSELSAPGPVAMTRTSIAERAPERFPTWKREPEASRSHTIASPLESLGAPAPSQLTGAEREQTVRSAARSAVAAYESGAKLQGRGRYEDALGFFLQAAELDTENVRYLEAAGLMASRVGDLAKAARLLERALAIREQSSGADDSEIASALRLIGTVYRDQQRYLEAESAFQRALTIDETVYGKHHYEVTRALSDLATLYQLEGRYSEAIALLEDALAIEEEIWGPQHANVASRFSSLGILYQSEGRTDDVEELLERTLFLREQTFGVDHPNTTGSLVSLADFYRKEGRYAEAEPLLLRTLAVHERSLESNHPRLAMDLAKLGVLYLSQAQYDQAEPYYARALLIEKSAQWSETPQVSLGINQLARSAGNEGRYDEADEIYHWALGVSISVLGSDDVNTNYLRDHYGEYLRVLGRDEEVDELSDG